MNPRRSYLSPVVWRTMVAVFAIWYCSLHLSVTTAQPVTAQPEPQQQQEQYWTRVRAEEEMRKKVALQLQESERQRNAIAQALEAANAEHAKVIAASLPPPPQIGFFRKHRDHLLIALAITFCAVLTRYTLGRLKRAAEIRALRGGYLSDGTEVASFEMPAVFSSQRAWIDHDAADLRPAVFVGTAVESLARNPVREFFDQAPANLAALRKALQEFARAANEAEWQNVLAELPPHVTRLREQSNLRDVHPVWQMSSALELLVKRVAERPKDATPSAIRTIGAAVDLLHALCVPGIRPNLVVDPPVRILAVDDEPLCLRALTFALQKASLTPDLAENGQRALAMASETAYDVIFMDIQMPEMDGLTACTKIHQTELNAETPVVFVTNNSDFQTRSLSNVFGGSDLMAKPFLILELTVKAMTFIMRKRLAQEGAVSNANSPKVALAPFAEQGAAALLSPAALRSDRVRETCSDKFSDASTPCDSECADGSEISEDFFTTVAAYLAATRKILTAVSAASDSAARQEELRKVYVRIQTLSAKARLHELEVVAHVSSTLEALFKRLHQNSRTITESTLNTVSTALNVLERLCLPGVEQKLVDHPSIRILVVEDEPLARRAIVGALQLAFEKPESVADGARASALVDQKPYDVIFTDVEMPVMDGFEFCRNVRASLSNRSTPVLFITNYTDLAVQAHAVESGATDFIGKPFLPIEIALKALTFAWEGRLRKMNASAVSSTAQLLPSHPSAPASKTEPTRVAVAA